MRKPPLLWHPKIKSIAFNRLQKSHLEIVQNHLNDALQRLQDTFVHGFLQNPVCAGLKTHKHTPQVSARTNHCTDVKIVSNKFNLCHCQVHNTSGSAAPQTGTVTLTVETLACSKEPSNRQNTIQFLKLMMQEFFECTRYTLNERDQVTVWQSEIKSCFYVINCIKCYKKKNAV